MTPTMRQHHYCPTCLSTDRKLRGGPFMGYACHDAWHDPAATPGDQLLAARLRAEERKAQGMEDWGHNTGDGACPNCQYTGQEPVPGCPNTWHLQWGPGMQRPLPPTVQQGQWREPWPPRLGVEGLEEEHHCPLCAGVVDAPPTGMHWSSFWTGAAALFLLEAAAVAALLLAGL